MRSIFILYIMTALFCETVLAKEPMRIRVPANESDSDVRHDYDHEIIHLLLSKTEKEFGPYVLQPSQRMNQFRALNGLISGQLLDMMPSVTSKTREKDLLPIKYSIHKSLMGVRLLLIKKSREQEFANIKDVSELKRLIAGQGADWPDVDVLRRNGFRVNTGNDYEGLFRMLSADRFDYFPRSVAEIYAELEAHKNDGFVVESTIALVYPQPAYIFVNKKNKELAARLEKAWQIVLNDGSFEELFIRKHGESIRKAGLKNRKIFFLENPIGPDVKTDFSILQQIN